MRYILAILFSLLFGTSNSQPPQSKLEEFKGLVLGKYNAKINSANEYAYYNTIISLTNSDNLDSFYKASKLMWAMWFYDSSKYSVKYFKPQITRINKRTNEFYINNLEGQWRFSHDFWSGLTTEITTTTAADTVKTILFKKGVAEFYSNDTLIRKTNYRLIFENLGFELSFYSKFKILFTDKKEYWRFTISQNKSNSGLNLTVFLGNDCDDCVCGSNIYKKE